MAASRQSACSTTPRAHHAETWLFARQSLSIDRHQHRPCLQPPLLPRNPYAELCFLRPRPHRQQRNLLRDDLQVLPQCPRKLRRIRTCATAAARQLREGGHAFQGQHGGAQAHSTQTTQGSNSSGGFASICSGRGILLGGSGSQGHCSHSEAYHIHLRPTIRRTANFQASSLARSSGGCHSAPPAARRLRG